MATRGRKAGKRATVPKRAKPIRKPKSAGSKAVRPKSAVRKSGAPKPGRREPGKPKSEMARLKRQLRTAQDRQAASAEILRTIGSVSGDAERSLHQIAETTKRLFEASSVSIFVADGDEWGQIIHDGASSQRIGAEVPVAQLRTRSHSLPGATFSENRQIHLPDIHNLDPAIADWPGVGPARAAGSRTISGTPLRRAGQAVGVLIVHRDRLAPFTADELALLQSFADQAAIAIENARLFNETREALERETATADILKVIASSPDDVQPVFEAIATSANRLIGGLSTAVHSVVDDTLHLVAFNKSSPAADASLQASYPQPLSALPWGEAIRNGEIVQIRDTDVEWADLPVFSNVARTRGFRSILRVPMLRDGATIGTINVARTEPGQFAAHHIQMLQTFADQAVIAIENVRLFNKTQEALERQTATADILKVIASSPDDVQPVFEAIAERSNRLIDGLSTAVYSIVDDTMHLKAFTRSSPEADAALQAAFPRPLSEVTFGDRIRHGEIVQIPDMELTVEWEVPALRAMAQLRGFRAVLFVPLLRNRVAIGLISITRKEPGAFAAHHVELLQTFADQAVIAIGNVQLFDEVQAKTRELSEALTYQTGSSNILGVIASSPTDVGPVLKAIVESACELCDAVDAIVLLNDVDSLRTSAHHGPIPLDMERWPISRKWVAGRAFLDRKPVHVHDLLSAEGDEFPDTRQRTPRTGTRSILSVPLLREGKSIGTIVLRRTEVHPFSEKQIALLQTFADQAVIAIGNVRLFDEVQAKTADLSEALQQQTATADVLKVISRSAFDLETVMNTLASSAAELCGASMSALYHREGDLLVARGISAVDEKGAYFIRHNPLELSDETFTGRAVLTGTIANIADTESETSGSIRKFSRALGYKAVLILPLMREGRGVGAFALARDQVGAFTPRQIELVQTFADQAVIAIENVRLFDEVQAKTRDLSDALMYQTGSGNILKVIASSPTDVGPVLQAIAESACELCEAVDASVFLRDGNHLAFSGHHGPLLIPDDRMPINRGWVAGRAFLDQKPVHVEDLRSDDGEFPEGRQLAEKHGHRTTLGVPLLRENESIGAIVVRRMEVRPFTVEQIELIRTFANQAVIAISNVNLFEQVEQRTRDLTESLQQQIATADVLKVISASPGELEPVFQVLLENAVRLCEAKFGVLCTYDVKEFRYVSVRNASPEYTKFMQHRGPFQAASGSMLDRLMQTRQLCQTTDESAEAVPGPAATLGGARSLVGVPMLKNGELRGAIIIYRTEVRPFADKQIELLTNFAAQAVIAIENAHLLNELRHRTDDLTKSLDNLRTAQDRLVQTEKLASLGQLTAGIAHEIKNPLNFVNNFSALSAELTDELNDVLKPVALDNKVRKEVDELTGMLKDNLEKVVQHGKRADSIVKNMLLHSREGSGEHRPADINALLDESLNLAYHGARAEKSGFNIILQRDFDAGAGEIELFPQEITRAFLNLISNGFYAATKRKTANDDSGFEPILVATTRNLGDTVEIRIRDNGTGIPAEVKEKMFNPFFTTKPAGEGTGLGLSMSHDIIVKQHGGTIDVETEPGLFTEFKIVLPRASRR
jgi:GAF domain-containing protein